MTAYHDKEYDVNHGQLSRAYFIITWIRVLYRLWSKAPLTENRNSMTVQLLRRLRNRLGQIPKKSQSQHFFWLQSRQSFSQTYGCRKASWTLIRTSGSCSSSLVQRSRNNCWCLFAGSITCLNSIYMWVNDLAYQKQQLPLTWGFAYSWRISCWLWIPSSLGNQSCCL